MEKHASVKCDILEIGRKQNALWIEEVGKVMPFKYLNWLQDKLESSGDIALEQIDDLAAATQGVALERLGWSGWSPGPFVQLDFTLLKRRNTEH